LETNIDVKSFNNNPENKPVLRESCERFQPASVKMLLDAGAGVDDHCGDGTHDTPLSWTIKSRCIDKDILDITSNSTDLSLSQRLMNKIAVINLLLDSGARTKLLGEDCLPLLHYCITAGRDTNRTAVARALLSRDPALLDVRDRGGVTPLMAAVMARNVTMTQFLVDSGADVLATDAKGVPVIFYVYSDIQPSDFNVASGLAQRIRDIVRILIKHGADPTVCDDEGRTAVMIASSALNPWKRSHASPFELFVFDIAEHILLCQ
jgi:ankyrin repeat protein